MTEEDLLAAKLKGYNVFIKFLDGEILLLKIENPDSVWFEDTEDFINKPATEGHRFPLSSIAVAQNAIKYVKLL